MTCVLPYLPHVFASENSMHFPRQISPMNFYRWTNWAEKMQQGHEIAGVEMNFGTGDSAAQNFWLQIKLHINHGMWLYLSQVKVFNI